MLNKEDNKYYLYNGDIYALIDYYLYGINNSKTMLAYKIKEDLKEINIKDYLYTKHYIEPSNLNEEETLDRLLLSAFRSFIAKEEWKEEAENKYDTDNPTYVDKFNDLYCFISIPEPITQEENEEDIDKAFEEFYEKHKKEIEREEEKTEKTLQKTDNEFIGRMDYYEKKFKKWNEILERIKKNGKIKKQLITGVSILNSFIYNDCNWGNKEEIPSINPKYKIYDYSFLIMNFIKASERFLSYKLSKKEGTMYLYVKEEKRAREVALNSNEFRKNAMLKDMLFYISENQDELLIDDIKTDREAYKKLLKEWKDNDRNGFFHKDSIETFQEAFSIILRSLEILIASEIYLK